MSALEFGLLKRLPPAQHKDVASMLRNLTSAEPMMASTCAMCLAVELARADGLTDIDLGDASLRIRPTPAGPRRPTPPPPAPRPVPA